jgi:hypothetical protein
MTPEEREAYNTRCREETEALRVQLEVDCPWLTKAVASRVWSYAWEHGHASGYHEVAYVFRDVASLFKPEAV